MTTPRDAASYGAPYVDAEPVADATEELSSDFANRALEDLAQITRTAQRAFVVFPLTVTAAPTNVTPSAGQSMMGSGSGALPTVGKTATGGYTLTYPASWVDGLGQTESISFLAGAPHLLGTGLAGCTVQIATIVNNVVTLEVSDATNAASDLGGTASVMLFLT